MPDAASPLVRELASLARLELSAEEAAGFGAQLETILGYIQRLQSVEVEGVPEYLTAEQVRSGLRDDLERPELDAEQALAGVPVVRDRLVAVPRFKD
ncbi:Glutamyl-tRNA(Gln) amidotransferase subunit C [Enhygromyxa salina]|uniref:Aspartyl/glutamyl-tRNA(Asn/Gln) amidotransferase subunit C n=1 Tax=Enhygromyxa salina TaxID=215803 RepID=A0A2S9XJ34_9BACT|nr:Asp-tRNA(Asn)/Glu-tRNA(Gln) amidotransferase subunit GatC [Enhygromyxa salina]PRP92885.1 Glutamyl-tRNA(Gln) amidotransferase subunit C [Enhygromyxa salina]